MVHQSLLLMRSIIQPDFLQLVCLCRKKTESSVQADPKELNSDDIDKALDVVQQQFGIDSTILQPSVLGQSIRNKSVPKFVAASDERFIQMFNVGDHWICATNVFSPSSHVVYVYDSVYRHLHHSLVVHVSSIL